MSRLRSTGEEGQAVLEYGGVLALLAAVVALVLAFGLPTEVAGALRCSTDRVLGLAHRCAAAARAPGVTPPRTAADHTTSPPTGQPVPATALSIDHPCSAPYVCRPPRRPSPPKPAPPARYGAWFYMGAPHMGTAYDLPCPPGYDFHVDLHTAQDYCAWRPYDPHPAELDENPGGVSDGRYEFPPTNVPGVQTNTADMAGTTQLVDQGTANAHYQYFPGGLQQYEDFQRLLQELSRAGDIASKPAKDREALEQQIENIAYGRSLEDAPGPGDTADPSEWEDPSAEDSAP